MHWKKSVVHIITGRRMDHDRNGRSTMEVFDTACGEVLAVVYSTQSTLQDHDKAAICMDCRRNTRCLAYDGD